VLRWLKTVVVSDRAKGAQDASGGVQEDVPEAIGWESRPIVVIEASKLVRRCQNQGSSILPWDGAWRVSADWPGGTRRRGGVSLDCCSRAEREKASVDSSGRSLGLCSHPAGMRERAEAATEGTEYRCGVRWRTGP